MIAALKDYGAQRQLTLRRSPIRPGSQVVGAAVRWHDQNRMAMKPHVDWRAKVEEALERTDIMALSTIGDDGSWTSPVQYRHGPKLELYFESTNDAKHVANIRRNPQVSVAIYRPEEFPGGGNLGLQIRGIAEEVTSESDRPAVGSAGWHTFRITPDEVWCFDSRVSRKRQKIALGRTFG